MTSFFYARARSAALIFSASLFYPIGSEAQFEPIPLTAESFNHDIVVERTAPRPLMPATTASMEGGITNTGFSWFEKGYSASYPAAGLPAAGSVIASDLVMDHEYQFAPDYRSNNAVLLDSDFTSAELELQTPAPFTGLSFLLSGAHDGSYAPVAYCVEYQDGSTQTGTVRCLDWLNNTYSAYSASGRVNVRTFTFANINEQLPKLFSSDVVLTNPASPVVRVAVVYVSGAGHSAIMALSGQTEPGGPFGPIAFTGYNADLVVEKSANRPQLLTGVTTATMANGIANGQWTWYEQGYVPGDLVSGLPPAGSMVTNAAALDCVYALAPDYGTNNAALLDADSPLVRLTPARPVACCALSFLAASAGGPTTNNCVIQHLDGTAQTNRLVSPDWLDKTVPEAFAAGGRVNVNTRVLDTAPAAAPCLFAAEVGLTNATSPVTNILVQWRPGGLPAHTAFLAVSAKASAPRPVPVLSIHLESGGTLVIESSRPGQLWSTSSLEGSEPSWQDMGTISNAVRVSISAGEPGRFYRVVGW